MSEQDPLTQKKSVAEVRDGLDALVAQVSRGETRVVIEQDGVPCAALVSTDDLRRLARFDAEREQHRRLLARLREPFNEVPPEQIERDVVDLVREVRTEMAAEHLPSAVER
jgi:PHD/YefM family antitoxin component YafN of YafNO toxin-antitoxin module